MKILIFGGSGFVGKQLKSYLQALGEEVYTVSRSKENNDFSFDIADSLSFKQINIVPDVIVNCASRIPKFGYNSKDPQFVNELFSTNVVGALNIANWAVKNKIPKIINCSTLVVVKKPWPELLTENYSNLPDGVHVAYCMSKLSQEQIMNEAVTATSTSIMHLRLSAVYGESMAPEGIIFNLLKQLDANNDIVLNDAEKVSFDFINVVDVCKAINAISKRPFKHNIVNLAHGIPMSLSNLVNLLQSLLKSKSNITFSVTDNPSNKANISIEILKEYIGDIYDAFITTEEGMATIALNFKK